MCVLLITAKMAIEDKAVKFSPNGLDNKEDEDDSVDDIAEVCLLSRKLTYQHS